MGESEHKIREMLEDAERKMRAADDRIEKAQRDKDRFGVEAETLRSVLNIMTGAKEDAAAPRQTHVGRASANEKWTSIYRKAVTEKDSPFTYEMLQEAAERAGYEVSMGGMRTQMMNAVNAGVFERAGAGKFVITDEGMRMIGLLPQRAEPPVGGSEAREGSPSLEILGREDDGDPSEVSS